ncbi:MAG: DUF2110 family protein [Candidatus Lokiarchaeota archaeon]|nr:DUF2110 family protein [Candidatus Lokiarchaeota archaeon]
MKTLILLDRFYAYNRKIDEKYLSRALIQLIRERTKNYDVDFEFLGLHSEENRPIIALSGKDEEFIYNYLIKEFGTTYDLSDLHIGQVLRGRIRDPDTVNFGLFIDCGIENPKKDALLPVYALREQLCQGKKITKNDICKVFGFFKEMPIYVEITEINETRKEITCKIAEKTLEQYNRWLSDGFEILFSAGIPRKQIKKAIKRTGHYEDYITIDRIGFLETASFFKLGCHAPGILSEIGPLLNNVKFSMLRPNNVIYILRSHK